MMVVQGKEGVTSSSRALAASTSRSGCTGFRTSQAPARRALLSTISPPSLPFWASTLPHAVFAPSGTRTALYMSRKSARWRLQAKRPSLQRSASTHVPTWWSDRLRLPTHDDTTPSMQSAMHCAALGWRRPCALSSPFASQKQPSAYRLSLASYSHTIEPLRGPGEASFTASHIPHLEQMHSTAVANS